MVNHFLGVSLFETGEKEKSLIYLDKAILLDRDRTWVSGWSYLYLGNYFASEGHIEKARTFYEKVLKSGKSGNYVSLAREYIFNLEDFKSRFELVQTEHIHFYFEKYDLVEDIQSFTREREEAFAFICSSLNVNPDFSLDYYVWDNRKEVYDTYGISLGFSFPKAGIIHSYKGQNFGHEITHCVAYRLYGGV